MSEDNARSMQPKPLIIAALIIGTIAVSVSLSVLVNDADSPSAELPEGIEFVYRPSVAPARGLARVDADCPAGTVVTGGGTYADAVSSTLLVLDNTPVRKGTRYAWRLRFSNKSDRAIDVGSVAVCARVAASASPGGAGEETRSSTVTTGRTPPAPQGAPGTTTPQR